MKTLNKEKLLKEIKTLLDISDNLALSIFHKVEELKHMYSEEIEQFEKVSHLISKDIKPTQIKFKLIKESENWTMSEPEKQEFLNIHNISTELIPFIVNTEINPGIIKMKKVEIKGQKYRLSFEKKNDACFSGTIEVGKFKNSLYAFNPLGAEKEDHKKDELLKTFLSYLMKDEDFYNFIMDSFQVKWQPIMDTKSTKGSNDSS